MSHFTTILTQIRDVDALADACGELGVELFRDTDARGFANSNVRSVIQTAEAISPCVLWIDEIEKGFGGAGGSGGSTDGGTSARVFGTMPNWLQDKTAPVFVVATVNDVSKLPPEMLRKGRWDELWFVDLPDIRERTAI